VKVRGCSRDKLREAYQTYWSPSATLQWRAQSLRCSVCADEIFLSHDCSAEVGGVEAVAQVIADKVE
jgi:hypothetical protein